MKYLYGPVPSRRLGRSLGVDPLPSKTCNYQCIYCQLGRTNNFTNTRVNYCPKQEIIEEIKSINEIITEEFDYLTFVGSGEPTLYKDLDKLIMIAKEVLDKPICVITNGSLLSNPDVQKSLFDVEVVLPTLDAGDEKTFRLINRPHPDITFNKLLEGFIDFKNKYSGNFWIEIMLMKNVNDSEEQLKKIKSILDKIQPDRIDINVPIRPPAEKWVEIPNKEVINLLDNIFGDYENINFPEMGKFGRYSSDFEKELLSIIERHPMRQEQIIQTFQSNENDKTEILSKLRVLEMNLIIERIEYQGKVFWKLK